MSLVLTETFERVVHRSLLCIQDQSRTLDSLRTESPPLCDRFRFGIPGLYSRECSGHKGRVLSDRWVLHCILVLCNRIQNNMARCYYILILESDSILLLDIHHNSTMRCSHSCPWASYNIDPHSPLRCRIGSDCSKVYRSTHRKDSPYRCCRSRTLDLGSIRHTCLDCRGVPLGRVH